MFTIVQDKNLLAKLIADNGSKAVMEKLLIDSGNGAKIDCHQQAHIIGRTSYKVFQVNAFTRSTYECHSGYIHGVMEGFLIDKGTTNLSAKITGICDKFDTSFKRFECLHGVGHGLMGYENYDLPEALTSCKRLADAFSQMSCYGGVFMENIIAGQGQGENYHETKWLSSDPLFPCNKVEDDIAIKTECYKMQTSRVLYLNNYDFEDAIKTCLTAEESIIGTCFRSLGRDAAGHTLRNNEKMLEICSKVPKTGNYYEDCIYGAVHVIIDFWGPALKSQASDFCAKIPEQQAREYCGSYVSASTKSL